MKAEESGRVASRAAFVGTAASAGSNLMHLTGGVGGVIVQELNGEETTTRKVMAMKSNLNVVVFGAVSFLLMAAAANATEVKIGDEQIHVNGCQAGSLSFTNGIPNSKYLDLSYKGTLSGIRVVVENKIGNASSSDFSFVRQGNSIIAVTYRLEAKGAGYWVNPPKVFGKKIGGGWCANATGAGIKVGVYAEYK